MSNSVFFQIGQCGNQLADSVWSSIRGRGLEAQCGAFVEGKVSSVCVDLEPRVLRRLKDADAKRQLYHAHHMLWSDSGAANNYAQAVAGAWNAVEQLRVVPFSRGRQRQRRVWRTFECTGRRHARQKHVRVCCPS